MNESTGKHAAVNGLEMLLGDPRQWRTIDPAARGRRRDRDVRPSLAAACGRSQGHRRRSAGNMAAQPISTAR
jgi:hypothetical protein